MTLITPTTKKIEEYVSNFDREPKNNLPDLTIKYLIEKFPANKKIEEIITKVIAINILYSTGILNNIKMAERISKIDFDQKIINGVPDLVHEIAVGHGIRSMKNGIPSMTDLNFYSFATKYCSWHNQKEYPIYDSFVEKILVAYQKQDGFSDINFKVKDLKQHPTFKAVVKDFQKYYELEANMKQIDKFLWLYGKEVFPPSWQK